MMLYHILYLIVGLIVSFFFTKLCIDDNEYITGGDLIGFIVGIFIWPGIFIVLFVIYFVESLDNIKFRKPWK